jgi:hypothetical protein
VGLNLKAVSASCAAMGLTMAFNGPALAQAPGQPSAVFNITCDRECLIGHARAYMAALVAHDPSLAQFSEDVRFTENNVEMPIGEALWGTISGLSSVRPEALEVADPYTGNVAWFGLVEEHGNPAYLAARIKVEGGEITEVETVVNRRPDGMPKPFGDPELAIRPDGWNDILTPEQQRSQARLVAVADSYFNTVERNDGVVFAPFSDECGRLENGISTTSGGGAASIAQGCEAQFRLGIYRINKRIRERRYPIVDVERGIVVAAGFFDHDNELARYALTDGREMNTALKWPNSISLLEAFKIVDGEIQLIEATFTYVPYFMPNPFAHPNLEFQTR